MTQHKLQDNILWHFYVLLEIDILKVDRIWTTKEGPSQTLTNMAAD